jgi:hypothetical protein
MATNRKYILSNVLNNAGTTLEIFEMLRNLYGMQNGQNPFELREVIEITMMDESTAWAAEAFFRALDPGMVVIEAVQVVGDGAPVWVDASTLSPVGSYVTAAPAATPDPVSAETVENDPAKATWPRCEACGEPYWAKRSDSRFCAKPECKMARAAQYAREHERRKREGQPVDQQPPFPESQPAGETPTATTDTPAGALWAD